MGINILPKSSLGRWSFGLAMAFLLILVLSQLPTRFNGFYPGLNPVLLDILLTLLIGISGVAFVTGLISLIKNGERSLLVFIGMAISLWVGLIGAVGYFII